MFGAGSASLALLLDPCLLQAQIPSVTDLLRHEFLFGWTEISKSVDRCCGPDDATALAWDADSGDQVTAQGHVKDKQACPFAGNLAQA